jgi:hypothetical protein
MWRRARNVIGPEIGSIYTPDQKRIFETKAVFLFQDEWRESLTLDMSLPAREGGSSPGSSTSPRTKNCFVPDEARTELDGRRATQGGIKGTTWLHDKAGKSASGVSY